MRIEIKNKLRPFSHRPGTRCLIPLTTWEVQVFPTKVFFRNLASSLSVEKKELQLPVKGPVQGFTVLQDLEKARIEVFGRGQGGYFRFFITGQSLEFKAGEVTLLEFIEKIHPLARLENLFLGVSKKQDWDLVQRRMMADELFPFLLRLSQLTPIEGKEHPVGVFALLQRKMEKEQIVAQFQRP